MSRRRLHVLDAEGAAALAGTAASNVLLAFDFDGTLAPIAERFDAAVLPASTRTLLHALADRYPCTVVSGRADPDLRRRLAGTGITLAIGRDRRWVRTGASARDVEALVRTWSRVLRRHLAGFKGVAIEDKRYAVAVHYRRAAEPERAAATAVGIAGRLRDARLVLGKRVLNVVPRGVMSKAEVIAALVDRLAPDAVVYVGDDRTDEPVFRLERTHRVVGIAVGRQASAAAYYLNEQSEVEPLLRLLRDARPAAGTRSAGRRRG